MERENSEGIRRDELAYALSQRRFVMTARRIDSCLLCRRKRVNEAGLCDACYSSLDGREFELASRWLAGVGP
ncbi:MAG: hypothetical protein ACOYON_09650 [Fimbriimonas sp.]